MSGNNAKQVESDINNKLINIDNWVRVNKPSINFSKKGYMLYSKKKKSEFNIIRYQNSTLLDNHRKDHIRYLGVLLENNLTKHYLIEKVRSKVVKGIWAIARLRNLVSTKVLLNTYYQGGVKDTRLKAKDSLSEDRPSRGQGQESSRPRPRTKDTGASVLHKKVFKNFFQAISNSLAKPEFLFGGDLNQKSHKMT